MRDMVAASRADDTVQLFRVGQEHGLGGEPGENTVVPGTPHSQAQQRWARYASTNDKPSHGDFWTAAVVFGFAAPNSSPHKIKRNCKSD